MWDSDRGTLSMPLAAHGDWSSSSSAQGRGLPVDLTLVFGVLLFLCQLLNSAMTKTAKNVNKRKPFHWDSAISLGAAASCQLSGIFGFLALIFSWIKRVILADWRCSQTLLFGQWCKVRQLSTRPVHGIVSSRFPDGAAPKLNTPSLANNNLVNSIQLYDEEQ